MRQAYACYAFSVIENRGLRHYIQYMRTENDMTKLLIAIENKLCDMSIYSRWPYNLYALKLQMKMHRIFRKTFAYRVQCIEYASSTRNETLTFCMTDMRE